MLSKLRRLNWRRFRECWVLLFLLTIFYFSSYTKISTETGPAEKNISIHFHWGGLVSVWEVLLLGALALIVARNVYHGRGVLNLGPSTGIFAFFALITISFVIGLLHSSGGVLKYGITGLKRPVIAYMTPVYFFLIYLICINTLVRRSQLLLVLRFLHWLTIGLLAYGVVRLFLMLAGDFGGLWFFGLPIVLYDQMAMLYAPIFILLALFFQGRSFKKRYWPGFALMLFFILCSTRRFNYLLLALGLFLTVALGYSLKLWTLPKVFKKTGQSLAVSIAGFAVVALLIPGFTSGVFTSIKTLNVWSKLGQQQSGDMRIAEFENLFENLNERPYTYIAGFGLGPLWRAIEPQPVDPLTRRLRLKRHWYTQFHLPYISMIYRLGLLGSAVFLFWFLIYMKNLYSRLKNSRRSLQPILLGPFVFLMMILPSLLDSFNPTAWTLCGLYAALLEKTTTAFSTSLQQA